MNHVEKMGEWAKQNPELVYGWAAMTWDGPPDVQEREGSMHMTPVVPAWRVMELESEADALKAEIAALRSNDALSRAAE